MTPTEQDKELREQIVAVMFEDEWFHCSEHGSVICAEANDERTKALNKIIHLITADRKRVALEARIELIDSMLNSNPAILHDCGKRLDGVFGKTYLEHKKSELKAQQEKVK